MSCQKKEVKVEYKLSNQQLTRLMYDVQLGEAAMSGVTTERGDTLKELLWTRLTTVYGLSRAEIKAEIEKLESDPERMKAVFDSIKVWSDTIKQHGACLKISVYVPCPSWGHWRSRPLPSPVFGYWKDCLTFHLTGVMAHTFFYP